MACTGPHGFSAQGFVGALHFFLSRNAYPEVGFVRIESEAVFPSDHYPVRLCLLTLCALTAPSNPIARARFKMRTGVSQQRQQIFVDSYGRLLSTPPAALPDACHHFVAVMKTATQAVCGLPSTIGSV